MESIPEAGAASTAFASVVREWGINPSSQPMKNTWSNSSPLEPWSVDSVTTLPGSSSASPKFRVSAWRNADRSRSLEASLPATDWRVSRFLKVLRMLSTLPHRRAAMAGLPLPLRSSFKRTASQMERPTSLASARSTSMRLRASATTRSSSLHPARAAAGMSSRASTRSTACHRLQPRAAAWAERRSTLVSPMPRGG